MPLTARSLEHSTGSRRQRRGSSERASATFNLQLDGSGLMQPPCAAENDELNDVFIQEENPGPVVGAAPASDWRGGARAFPKALSTATTALAAAMAGATSESGNGTRRRCVTASC